MADEDNKQSSQTPDINQAVAGLKSELDSKLAAVTELLKAQNAQNAQAYAELKAAVAPPKPKGPLFEDGDLYDASKIEEKVSRTAAEIADAAISRNNRVNAKIYELQQKYPEIQSDPEVQKQVVAAHDAIPKALQGTPEGYEMAVLKTASERGLLPKAKRQQAEIDEPIAGGGSSPSGEGARERRASKGKVAQETLEFAALLGRPVDDPEYQKRLASHVQRDTYGKYR